MNGSLLKEWEGKDLTHTWSASSFLKGLEVEYAYLYAQDSLTNACPDFLKDDLKVVQAKMKAYANSFYHSKIDLNEHCFYDLVPKSFLLELCEVKNQITDYVFKNYKKPTNQAFLTDLLHLTQEIGQRKLNLNFSKASRDVSNLVLKNKISNLKAVEPYIRYDIFGSKTGRMTVLPNTFPILNLNKTLRSVVEPHNDYFIELDYNAFELRVLLYLLDLEQPEVDIHDWNVENIFANQIDRDEAKKQIFSWLYNLEKKNEKIENIYNRNLILEKYWDGAKITNPFGNQIESDKFHAISYLVQRTATDIVLRQMIKIWKMLEGKKSFIAFTVHDSVVLDVAKEELEAIKEVQKQFSVFRSTSFLSNMRLGRNYGDMKEV